MKNVNFFNPFIIQKIFYFYSKFKKIFLENKINEK